MSETITDGMTSEARKACSTCHEVKPLAAFAADRRHSDGRQSRCRACHRSYQKRWAAEDPEKVRRLKAEHYQRNKVAIREKQAAYAPRKNQLERERRARATPEELERIRARHRAASAAYLARHPERCAERIRNWQRRNSQKQVDAVNRRRARKKGVAYEAIDVDVVGERDGWVCGICQEPVDPSLRFPDQLSRSVDHVIPLLMEGPHTMANVRIAHWICNVRRGAARGEPAA